jgi:hypothetical protein
MERKIDHHDLSLSASVGEELREEERKYSLKREFSSQKRQKTFPTKSSES